jgi:predicted transcriptional regulator
MQSLTEQEVEAMQLLWANKGGFIKDLLELMPEPKLPYTTLASTVKNLEKKKYVKGEKLGNSFRYKVLISEDKYKKTFINRFVSEYFKDSYKELVSFFAKEEKISSSELEEIMKMIKNSKK